MEIPINKADPKTMHVDLNACFAKVEQQANRLLRGKPVGVAANLHPRGTIIAASYEAKAIGINTGLKVHQAKSQYKNAVIVHSDPDKYFFVHQKFLKILRNYSPDVTAISIDEAYIDFSHIRGIDQPKLVEIGHEIKARIREEIGEWLTCNIGIGPSRFTAKLASSLHKPDGLDIISHKNLTDVYSTLALIDLPGINVHYQERLTKAGISTPLELLHAPLWKLKDEVFHSLVAYYWYMRIRGYEVDGQDFERRSYGQAYHLHTFTADDHELGKLLMKLCEKMGRRLRRAGYVASGIQVFCALEDGTWWGKSKHYDSYLFATTELYEKAMEVLEQRPKRTRVSRLAVACFDLKPLASLSYLPGIDDHKIKTIKFSHACDEINNKYGEYFICPAKMLGLEDEIVKRVPFHATSNTLEEFYYDLDDTEPYQNHYVKSLVTSA